MSIIFYKYYGNDKIVRKKFYEKTKIICTIGPSNNSKEAIAEPDKPIKILLDTKGPEIRTGKFINNSVTFVEGSHYTVLCGEDIIGDERTCSISYKDLYKDVNIGDLILIADGLIDLKLKK